MKTHKYHTIFHQSNHFSRNVKHPSHTSKEIASLIKKEKKKKRKDMISEWTNDNKDPGSQMLLQLIIKDVSSLIIDYIIN